MDTAEEIAEARAAMDRELLAALAQRAKPNRKQRRAAAKRSQEERVVEVTLLAFARWQKAGSPDKTIIPKSQRRKRSRKTGNASGRR